MLGSTYYAQNYASIMWTALSEGHFHPTRSFCTLTKRQKLRMATFIQLAITDYRRQVLRMATFIQLADSAPWEAKFQDGHFHPTRLCGGQMVHGHIQPTVQSQNKKNVKIPTPKLGIFTSYTQIGTWPFSSTDRLMPSRTWASGI